MYFEIKNYTKNGYVYGDKIQYHEGVASVSIFFKRNESNDYEEELKQIIELINKIDGKDQKIRSSL